jgi:putative Mg2+ transporter-C (MgtC) family protein
LEEILTPYLFEELKLVVLGRLILASILGGAIGLERELSGKEAGLRTNILICIGSALLTVLSLRLGHYLVETAYVEGDPSRLMAAIISGIGFLGAGTIIQARGSITGLTTAATLWVVAAIGIAVGAGTYIIATGTTIFVLAILIPLGLVEGLFLESPHHWVKAKIKKDLKYVNQLRDELRDRSFEIVDSDINLIEGSNYEVLLEIKGDHENFLDEMTYLHKEFENIEDLTIVPSHSTN